MLLPYTDKLAGERFQSLFLGGGVNRRNHTGIFVSYFK